MTTQLALPLRRSLRDRVVEALAHIQDDVVVLRERGETRTGADVRRVLQSHLDADVLHLGRPWVEQNLRWAEVARRVCRNDERGAKRR